MISITHIDSMFFKELTPRIAVELWGLFSFPSEKYLHDILKFFRDPNKQPDSAFYRFAIGISMIDVGIDDWNNVDIDMIRNTPIGSIMVDSFNNDFTINYNDSTHDDEIRVELR